jgi:hypothetical protein
MYGRGHLTGHKRERTGATAWFARIDEENCRRVEAEHIARVERVWQEQTGQQEKTMPTDFYPYEPIEQEAPLAYRLCCDRCGDVAEGVPTTLVADAYLIDDPYKATGNLCPACALEEDPHHIRGSWLLTW